MTIAAQGGLVGFGLQTAKIGRGGVYAEPGAVYKVRAPRVNMGAVQSVQALPPEVGGALTPTGVYKDQRFFAGDFDLLPRAKTVGVLLLGALGKVTTMADSAFGTANVGVNTHKFTYDSAAPASQPWMVFRRMTPGAVSAQNSGETGFDCKINGIRLTVPGRGKVVMRASIQGRDFVLDDASAWTWENANYEDAGLIYESGRGYFKVGGTRYPILNLQFDIVNNLTSPNDEQVVGDFAPDDFIALRRAVTLRATYKYEDDDLYRKLLTGQADGTTWDSLPFFTSTSGPNKGIEAFFEAPSQVPGAATAVNYAIKLTAEKVAWQVDGPPVLQGGGVVLLNLLGTVIQPDSGDYFTAEIINEEDAPYYVAS
jgi:hypothetical protein